MEFNRLLSSAISAYGEPELQSKKIEYQKSRDAVGAAIFLALAIIFWVIVFLRYSDIYVRRFGGFLLWIHNRVRNKKDNPEPIVPDDQSGFHDNPNNDEGKKKDKLVEAGVFLVFASAILGAAIWYFISNENGDLVKLVDCRKDDIRPKGKNGTCPKGSGLAICNNSKSICMGIQGCGDGRVLDQETCACNIKTIKSDKPKSEES